eukprot:8905409-Lingulodinium_polyedra.AAC.1
MAIQQRRTHGQTQPIVHGHAMAIRLPPNGHPINIKWQPQWPFIQWLVIRGHAFNGHASTGH